MHENPSEQQGSNHVTNPRMKLIVCEICIVYVGTTLLFDYFLTQVLS